LIVGPYGRWDDPYILVSMFWSAIGLTRLLAMLAVVWRGESPQGDPKIEVRCTAQHGLVLVSGAQEFPLDGWWLGEDRLRPASPDEEVPAGRLMRQRVGGDVALPAKVCAGGALEFVNPGARGAFLSMLVAMRLDERTPYRPASAIARVTARMFGLAWSAR
jgi:hypothetical protein